MTKTEVISAQNTERYAHCPAVVSSSSSKGRCMGKIEDLKIDARKKSKSEGFAMPQIGEPLDRHAKQLDLELLARGRLDFIKYLESVKGQLTQEQYTLVRTSALSQDTLMATSDRLHAKNIETKFLLIKRRFYLDADGIVRDHKNKDTIVCEPELIFDLILCGHLNNKHIHWRRLHRFLKLQFANITRDFTQMCIRYCSKCNADKKLEPQQKYRHYNIYSGLLPLERIHVEIITPFPKAVESLYPHFLYFRDYHSRFVWMQPLESDHMGDLKKALSTFLLSLPRIPIFIETSTLDRKCLFEMCESIASRYALTMGLGMSQSVAFQKNGITRVLNQLNSDNKSCLDSWHMCLKKGAAEQNLTYNTRVLAVPGDLLCSTMSDYSKQFELKREKLIEKLWASNVVELRHNGRRQGLLYLEDEASAFLMPDEEHMATENEHDLIYKSGTPVDGATPVNSSPLRAQNFFEPPSSAVKKLLVHSSRPDAQLSPEIGGPSSVKASDSFNQAATRDEMSLEL
ncbi:LADA_0F03356g1_1 [Lachancea dasiensis]|uniref:LADA_0F03356g1_1 n=1 Tax=Lachancea dasiensis TaxID=1072105 RepID=A0A1G4JIX0_9SACH|nr:LADA_0F03356g1_1 [Lachancea dasiensis]